MWKEHGGMKDWKVIACIKNERKTSKDRYIDYNLNGSKENNMKQGHIAKITIEWELMTLKNNLYGWQSNTKEHRKRVHRLWETNTQSKRETKYTMSIVR